MIADWDAAFAGYWDYVVRRSSPLRAAVLRSLKAAVAVILQMTPMSINWNISALFDNIYFADLIPQALRRNFHPRLLAMAMRVHRGYRTFKGGQVYFRLDHKHWQSFAGWMCDERELD